MNTGERSILEFEGYRLDVAKRELLDPKRETIKLMPKAFDILAFLAQNNDRVVSKDELLTELWPNTIVEENNLTQNISALRRAFGEKPQENRFISTIPGRGYRFVAIVRQIEPESDENSKNNGAEPRSNVLSFSRWWLLLAAIPLAALLTYFFFWPSRSEDKLGTLAVLPFKPITAETGDEALELGMADSLITKLATGNELRVLPLAAVRRFNSQETDPQTVGRRLGVDAVLDGSMQV